MNIEQLEENLFLAESRKASANKEWRRILNCKTSLGGVGQAVEDEWVNAREAVRNARRELAKAKKA